MFRKWWWIYSKNNDTARYDLSLEGFYEEISMEWGDNGSTYIVDACNGVNGEVDWDEEDSFFRTTFHPKFIKKLQKKLIMIFL